jgi:outer membrane protein TolC
MGSLVKSVLTDRKGMQLIKALLVTLMILALVPPGLRGQNGQSKELTLDEAVRMALARNEQALTADAQLSAAQAVLFKARGYFLPTLDATGTYTRYPNQVTRTIGGQTVTVQNYNSLSSVASLNLTVFDSRGIPGLRNVKSTSNAQASSTAEAKRQLAFEASQAFLATLSTAQLHEASQRRFEYAKQNLDAAKARYDAGLVSVNDVTRAQLEFATAEMGVTQSDGETKTAYLQLGYLLNDPTVSQATLVSPEFLVQGAEVDSARVSQFIFEAEGRRLDLDALRWQAKAQHALVMEPILRFLPSINIGGQYDYTNTAGLSGSTTRWTYGLSLNWPIFDGFVRNADYSSAKAQARIADLAVSSQLRKVEVDVRNALVSLSSAHAALKEADVAHEVAQRNAVETGQLYRQGLASALEAADANVSLFEAEVALVNERYAVALAYLNFEAALGLDPFGKEPQR